MLLKKFLNDESKSPVKDFLLWLVVYPFVIAFAVACAINIFQFAIFQNIKFTDWVMAGCTVGILIGTFAAAKYAKKSVRYTRLSFYLDKNVLNNLEINLIINLKLILGFIDRSPMLSLIIKEKEKEAIDNSIKIFKEHYKKSKLIEIIPTVNLTLKKNSVLIERVLHTNLFELSLTIDHLCLCIFKIISNAEKLHLEENDRVELLKEISKSYDNLLDCMPYISNSILSLESNLNNLIYGSS